MEASEIRHLTEEHKRKIGEANRGRKRPDLASFNRTRTDLRHRRCECPYCGRIFESVVAYAGHISTAHVRAIYTVGRAEKISKSLMGHTVSSVTRAKIGSAHRGIPETDEANFRRSLALMGSRNHQWRGGLTAEEDRQRKIYEYIKFKKTVLKRDGYRCRECGAERSTEVGVVAHHIKPFSKFKDLRFDPRNGITLCRSCHMRFHRKKR